MAEEELERIEFQSHGQDARAIRFLRQQLAESQAENARLREAMSAVTDVLKNGRASDDWVTDRLSAALKEP